MKFKVISLVCIISLLFQVFVFNIPVYAVENVVPVPGYSELKEMDEDIKNGDNRTLQDLWNTLQPIGSAIGIVMNPIQTIEFIRDIVDPVAETLPDYPTNGTETDKANYVSSYLINNTTINDSDKTYSLNQNAKYLINGIVDNYINESGYTYVYSYDLRLFLSDTNNGDIYNATRDFVLSNQNTNYIYMCSNLNEGGTLYLYMCPMNSDYALINMYDYGNYYSGRPYKFSDWNYNIQMARYQFNRDTNTWDFIRNDINDGGLNPSVKKENDNLKNYSVAYWLTCNGVQSQVLFYSLIDMKKYSQGELPYYFNNSVYNDWSQSSGDYIVTTDNSNTVTYGDITNYIGNSYNETGNYPSVPDINNFIENYIPNVNPTPTPNPDNPSGSGSFVNNNSPVFNNNPNININLLPGDGTVSGNGTGGSSGIGNIFGFLSDIGKFLGDLIKNLGQALVDVIKGIGDLFNSIITDLPTVFFDFLGAVFNWLPEEWVRLMGLSFACMLIVGVIKIFRR